MERTIDGRRFKVLKLLNPLLIHWVLNPSLAFNELVFGQRIPREILIEQDVPGDLIARQHVQCPACGTLTSWARYKAAGLQFGLYRGIPCQACASEVPQLLNAVSWLVLTPLRFLPGGTRRKQLMLARQAERLRTADPDEAEAPDGPPSFVRQGFAFGLAMAVFFVISNVIGAERGLAALERAVWSGAAAGALAGVLFGFGMWLVGRRTRAE